MEAIVYTTKEDLLWMQFKNIIIRLETKEDYRAVENLTREYSGMSTARAAWSTMCCTVSGMTGICAGAGFCDGTGR